MGIDQYMGILAINEYRDKHNSTIPDKIGMVSGFGFYHIVNPHKWIDLHRCTQFQWGRSCFAFFSGATSSSNRSWVRSINTRTIQVGFIWADSHATSDQLFDWRYMNNDPLFRLDIGWTLSTAFNASTMNRYIAFSFTQYQYQCIHV